MGADDGSNVKVLTNDGHSHSEKRRDSILIIRSNSM